MSPQSSLPERMWRNAFFYLSALMAALALVDFDAGRFAHGLGDAGIACLMLSLRSRFPLVRVLVGADARAQSRADMLRRMQELRRAHRWADLVSAAGWLLLFASLVLRTTGID